MPTAKVIDVQEFINSHKLSSVQVVLLVLCFLIVAIDGFDTAAIGFIAPAIRADWQLTPGQLAPLFGSGLVGLMAGAFRHRSLSNPSIATIRKQSTRRTTCTEDSAS
jgi:MFS transporter, AAHS family, 4-hydroxybenzoate transporter